MIFAMVNQITALPETFHQLKTLQVVKLDDNPLDDLPLTIFHLKDSLSSITFDRCPLSKIPEPVRTQGWTAITKHLEEQLQKQELFAKWNPLARLLGMLGEDGELPSIEEMKKITILNVRNKGIQALPEVLWECKEVREADFHGNRISVVSEGLSVWSRLRLLDFTQNNLRVLPTSIGELAYLRELILYGNKLTELPNSIGCLSELRTLNLHSNQLTRLPESIGNCDRLRGLWLDRNPLEILPYSILHLRRLDHISFTDCPFPGFPESVRVSGYTAMLLYLKETMQQKETLNSTVTAELSSTSCSQYSAMMLIDSASFYASLPRPAHTQKTYQELMLTESNPPTPRAPYVEAALPAAPLPWSIH
jgi:Leucine-rich repeat (LRR) protein